ncbi:hypothetical protein [Peribacillus sp. Hz7]|uniref:hypothetical protein n=1 Tax=Peribacillus sp. Hz7 TaxID=3344873 RepID=UPI0035C94C4D
MNRRNFLLNFLLWILLFIFGYRVGNSDIKSDVLSEELAEIAYQLNPNMTTKEIQSALDTYNNFIWNSGVYNVNPIFLKSNSYHKFAPNVTIMANSGFLERDCLINVIGQENVFIDFNNAVLQMRYDDYTIGEWRHCLNIQGSKNIKINDVLMKDSGGDGLYIGANGDGNYSENVITDNIEIDHCRRQGISIASGKNINIVNTKISNIIGANPQFGVDIEPNNPLDVIEKIFISNIETNNCAGGGISIALQGLAYSQYHTTNENNYVDIHIDNFKSNGDKYGISLNPTQYRVNGTCNFKNVSIINSKANGILGVSWYTSKTPKVTIEKCDVINPNSNNATGDVLGSGIVFYNPSGLSEQIGNIVFKDVFIKDDRGVSQLKNGLYSLNLLSTYSVDIVIDNFNVTGETGKAITVYGSIRDIGKFKPLIRNLTASNLYNGNIDYKNVITNSGATTDITASLDFLTVGEIGEFKVETSFYFKIKPYKTTDLLYPDITGGNKYLRSNKVGSSVKIKKVATDKYMVIEQIGVWETLTL